MENNNPNPNHNHNHSQQLRSSPELTGPSAETRGYAETRGKRSPAAGQEHAWGMQEHARSTPGACQEHTGRGIMQPSHFLGVVDFLIQALRLRTR